MVWNALCRMVGHSLSVKSVTHVPAAHRSLLPSQHTKLGLSGKVSTGDFTTQYHLNKSTTETYGGPSVWGHCAQDILLCPLEAWTHNFFPPFEDKAYCSACTSDWRAGRGWLPYWICVWEQAVELCWCRLCCVTLIWMWEKTSSWMAEDTNNTRSPSELSTCPPPVTSSLGYLRSAIWTFSYGVCKVG